MLVKDENKELGEISAKCKTVAEQISTVQNNYK